MLSSPWKCAFTLSSEDVFGVPFSASDDDFVLFAGTMLLSTSEFPILVLVAVEVEVPADDVEKDLKL